MTASLLFNFDNSYARLPERFFAHQKPTPVSTPSLIAINEPLAEQLGLDPAALVSDEGLAMLSGNALPEGADPIATAYAGHQFGGWNPQLGDGRALLLGEVLDTNNTRYDIQLKGSGRTPFSRSGDGRAPVGPVVREFIVSEAMAAMGIPTTRALAAVWTDDTLFRERPEPGAVLTRVAHSHVRVGTFQYFAARRDNEAIECLTQYVLKRHFPEQADSDNPALSLLELVLQKQAELVAQWQAIGFIHGVMNTDNTSIPGLTIDYGPCAFMDNFHTDTVFSSIDWQGRYAYKNQPGIAQWNVASLAQCLLPLIDDDEKLALKSAQKIIDSFPNRFVAAYLDRFRKKLGLFLEDENDAELINELLACMEQGNADFTNTFRALSHCALVEAQPKTSQADAESRLFNQFSEHPSSLKAISAWLKLWRVRHEKETAIETERSELMLSTNPAYIPRNHRIEQAIQAAEQQDYGPTRALFALLSTPFVEQPGMDDYANPPEESEVVKATFCGT